MLCMYSVACSAFSPWLMCVYMCVSAYADVRCESETPTIDVKREQTCKGETERWSELWEEDG